MRARPWHARCRPLAAWLHAGPAMFGRLASWTRGRLASWTRGRLAAIGGPVGFGLAAACLAACSTTIGSTTPSGKLQIVAGENFWGNIAAQIGGPHVAVTSILSDPNADPHLYESSAANALAVAEAGLVIRNGAGYDDWLSQLLGSTSHAGRRVVTVSRVLDMTGTGVNPHFWYDIPEIPRVARAVETALAELAPAHAKAFAGNLVVFDRSLGPLEAVIAEIRQRYPGYPVAYTERVPGYLLRAAGLHDETPLGFATAVEDGNDPSPEASLAMDSLVTGHKIKVLLYNAQTVSAVTQHVENLARTAGVPVVAVTETMPPSDATYQAWQLGQARALLRALGSRP
ncbi:MAG TPA: zinc ABC transporter substrate-binding protein [Acidimicrobiales bacterium]|nr:zinc ABC transporter substrate-binding protein [Acidimicrobiales bacterium]